MSNTSSNSGLKVALGIALVLFIGTGIYTATLYKQKQENEKQLAEEKQLVMKDLNDMAAQYDLAISENEVANSNLVDAKARIHGLLDSLKVAETNVKTLWKYQKKYLALQDEMNALLTENDKLRIKNQLLASTLDSTKVQLEERTVFTDSLLVQNTNLAKVVEDAAILNTTGLKGFGVIVRSSGKLIPTERARRSDKIRVCYTVAKNKLVNTGDKAFYVQVVDPDNKVLGVSNNVVIGGKTIKYSLISKFNYENTNLNICEFVAKPTAQKRFSKGRYIVSVFNENEIISKSEFTLR